jgi:hypothetical protein
MSLVTRKRAARLACLAKVIPESVESVASAAPSSETCGSTALRAEANGREPVSDSSLNAASDPSYKPNVGQSDTKPVEAESLANQVKSAHLSLRPPPNDFDLFRDASSCAFTLTELIAAIHQSPGIAADAIHLANSASYQIRHDAVVAALATKPPNPSMVSHRILLSMCLVTLLTGILIGGLAVTSAGSWGDGQHDTGMKANADLSK